MNAKQVLDKVLAALSLVKENVAFTQAQSADGTILDSKTFDVNEEISEVSEDGTVSPAKDGEYEVVLKDSDGNEERIKVVVKDGVIAERENVELPEADTESKGEVAMDSIAGDDIASPEAPNATENEPEDIPQTMESLSYSINELTKAVAKMQAINEKLIEVAPQPVIDFLVAEKLIDSTKPLEKVETKPLPGDPATEKMAAVDGGDEEDTTDEEELPKLDGAPVEDEPKPTHKFNKNNSVIPNSQNTFLSKLYK
jgi:hypothetical protein